MDIVDGQVHANVMGTETTLAVMDAIGIQAVLIDEYLRPDENGSLHPSYLAERRISSGRPECASRGARASRSLRLSNAHQPVRS
jgi:L-fuconolactonase